MKFPKVRLPWANKGPSTEELAYQLSETSELFADDLSSAMGAVEQAKKDASDQEGRLLELLETALDKGRALEQRINTLEQIRAKAIRKNENYILEGTILCRCGAVYDIQECHITAFPATIVCDRCSSQLEVTAFGVHVR